MDYNTIRNETEGNRMKATAAVRDIMSKKSVSLVEMANSTDRSKQATWERLNQENISVSKLNELLAVLGYKVMIVPDNVKAEDGWYVAE